MNSPTLEELKRHSILGTLGQAELEQLVQSARIQDLRRHDSVFESGDKAEKVILVRDGTIKLTGLAFENRDVILDVLGPGDLVGDEAIMDDRRSVSATVLRDAVLIELPASLLRSIVTRNSEFASAWLKSAFEARTRLQRRITEMAYGNIENRLIRMLGHLSQRHGARTKKGNTILRFPLTHQELAGLIGATRETTTLAVGRLRSSGQIAFLERKIVLKDGGKVDLGEADSV